MKHLLDLLNKEELNYLEYKQYSKNEIIFSEGLLCNYVGFILYGDIIISTITNNYKEEIINILHEGEIFANNLIFSNSPYFLGNIIANSNVKIAFISKKNLFLIFKNNQNFLTKYLELMSNQVLEEKNKNKILSHKNIRDRLLYYFSLEQKKNGQVRIKSIADLARKLSLPRPSVSREIYKLINDNIIEYNNKIIIIK